MGGVLQAGATHVRAGRRFGRVAWRWAFKHPWVFAYPLAGGAAAAVPVGLFVAFAIVVDLPEAPGLVKLIASPIALWLCWPTGARAWNIVRFAMLARLLAKPGSPDGTLLGSARAAGRLIPISISWPKPAFLDAQGSSTNGFTASPQMRGRLWLAPCLMAADSSDYRSACAQSDRLIADRWGADASPVTAAEGGWAGVPTIIASALTVVLIVAGIINAPHETRFITLFGLGCGLFAATGAIGLLRADLVRMAAFRFARDGSAPAPFTEELLRSACSKVEGLDRIREETSIDAAPLIKAAKAIGFTERFGHLVDGDTLACGVAERLRHSADAISTAASLAGQHADLIDLQARTSSDGPVRPAGTVLEAFLADPPALPDEAKRLLDAVLEQHDWARRNVPWVLRRGFAEAVGEVEQLASGQGWTVALRERDIVPGPCIADPASGVELRVLKRRARRLSRAVELTTELTGTGRDQLARLVAEGVECAGELADAEGRERLSALAAELQDRAELAAASAHELGKLASGH